MCETVHPIKSVPKLKCITTIMIANLGHNLSSLSPVQKAEMLTTTLCLICNVPHIPKMTCPVEWLESGADELVNSEGVDGAKKSDTPTSARPPITRNMPPHSRPVSFRCRNSTDNIPTNTITAPVLKNNMVILNLAQPQQQIWNYGSLTEFYFIFFTLSIV